MPQLITTMSAISLQVIDNMSKSATAIVSQPVMLIGIGIVLLGAGVGIVKKFF